MQNDPNTTEKTVVALFEFEEDAKRAADELERNGYARESIQIVSGHELSHPKDYVTAESDVESKVLGAVGKGLSYGAGLGALAGGLVAPVLTPLVIGGALATMFFGAGLGASVGGFMAALMKAGVDESNARLFEAALRHGGVVLALKTNEENARRAVRLLDRQGALDMDEHGNDSSDRGADRVEGATDNRVSDMKRDHSVPRS